MAQIISTKKSKILTDRIDRNRNVHMYGEDCVFNNFGGLNIAVKTGTTNTIEIQPGLYQVGGTIAQSEFVENLVVSNQPNGDYSVVAKMNLKTPQAQIVVQDRITPLKKQNLVDLEQGERDFLLATFELVNGNILGLKMTPNIKIDKSYNINELGVNAKNMQVQINRKFQKFTDIIIEEEVHTTGSITIPYPLDEIVAMKVRYNRSVVWIDLSKHLIGTTTSTSGTGVGGGFTYADTHYVEYQIDEIDGKTVVSFKNTLVARITGVSSLTWLKGFINALKYTIAETD